MQLAQELFDISSSFEVWWIRSDELGQEDCEWITRQQILGQIDRSREGVKRNGVRIFRKN